MYLSDCKIFDEWNVWVMLGKQSISLISAKFERTSTDIHRGGRCRCNLCQISKNCTNRIKVAVNILAYIIFNLQFKELKFEKKVWLHLQGLKPWMPKCDLIYWYLHQ